MLQNKLYDNIEKGNLDVVKCLASQGADVKANNNYAIKSASQNGHLEVVKYLVGQEADTNKIKKVNKFIKYLCDNNNFEELYKVLKNNSDYPNIKKQVTKIYNNLLKNKLLTSHQYNDTLIIT